MKILLKSVRINDPQSPQHGEVTDVLVEDGFYKKIGKNQSASGADKVLDAGGSSLSPGWFDMRVNFKEPGEEQKETIHSGQKAAAAGGFTAVLLMPGTRPVLQTSADISFVKRKASGYWVEVFPAGVLTENREGKELSGMYDMMQAGAVAFTDEKRAIRDSGVMLRAMQYAGNINATVIAYADDPGLTTKLQANESPSTTLLGFKGMPSIAEEISIQRDLSLVIYSGQKLHISGVSTKEAVEVIREARRKGLAITAEVYIYHLMLDDTSLDGFDSLFKVKPPLRTSEDIRALKEAVLDGTIDVVCSDHCPEDVESKDVEFDYAAYGMIGLESFYGVLNTAFDGKLSEERLYEVLVLNPRRILNLEVPIIKEGAPSNFTLYNPGLEWVFDKKAVKSLSANSPFLGTKFKGKVILSGNQGGFSE